MSGKVGVQSSNERSKFAVARWLGIVQEKNGIGNISSDTSVDLCVHSSHACVIDEKTMVNWVMPRSIVPDTHNYYPIYVPKSLGSCVYVHINKTSPLFGRLFRLTCHPSGKNALARESDACVLESLQQNYATFF